MKIFSIGLSRTGTTSLTIALARLGIHSYHFPRTLELIESVGAATDRTVAAWYRDLDNLYPGSKFILTVRNLDDWLDSCEALWRKFPQGFDSFTTSIHRSLYGRESFDRTAFAAAYSRHHDSVVDHFSGRELDLLLLDVCAGEGWEKLCPFLGYDISPDVFPRRNVRSDLGRDWVLDCPPQGSPVPRRERST